MIQNSFIHLPGIGETTEEKLWSEGIRTWDDLEASAHDVFGAKKAQKVLMGLANFLFF